ncbi:type II toxin-antitoxin system RelE/ParE family toxin [bacterium]|nr:type II toxin-antitoxin system RelE/ParE family toxin [bacterium]
MEIVLGPDFERRLAKLPKRTQSMCYAQISRFKKNPRDARLHVKKLHGLGAAYSFRITREYRVLFYFHAKDIVILFAIGHRKNIYR